MKQPTLRLMIILIVMLFQFGYSPAYCKVKLSPTIEFDGKAKDKLPNGKGELIITYTGWNRGTKYQIKYATITGVFSGDTIKEARFHLPFNIHNANFDTYHGIIIYSVEYDKTKKTTDLTIKLTDGGYFNEGETISGFPTLHFLQKEKEEPEVTFEPSSVVIGKRKEIHALHCVVPTVVYQIFTREPVSWTNEKGKQFDCKISAYKSGNITIDPVDESSPYKYLISNTNGSKCSAGYNIYDFDIQLKDGGRLKANIKEIKNSFERPKYVPNYTIVYPDGGRFTGTIIDERAYNILNNSKDNSSFEQFRNICNTFEQLPASTIKPKDGTLLTSDRKKVDYTNGLSETELTEKVNAPQILQVNKPGTLLSVISPEELRTCVSLSIVGPIDDSDLKILTDLGKNIVNLDLRLAYTTLSEKTRNEREANAQALTTLFGLMGASADAQYNDLNLSTLDYVNVKSFTTLVQNALAKTKTSDKNCVIPKECLSGMPYLRTLTLPIWCSRIESDALGNCKNLEEVILSPYLESIGSYVFAYCSKLKSIKFPSTLIWIKNGYGPGTFNSGGAFLECTSLRDVDLSSCIWSTKSWDKMFHDCNLDILKLPSGIETASCSAKKIYLQKGIRYLCVPQYSEIYCQDMTPPSNISTSPAIRNCTFYVPKGSLTAYYAQFGKENKIVEY